ncbi:MAG: hypothetical protein NTY15_16725 [Planctomycetota bacterium]|jgi:hypothetical protein|nr:hypothetical protein [Planctomycetota bacterium]
MIFFWLREIAGWALILVSLYMLRIGLVYLNDLERPALVESGIVMLTGLGVMRCGVLLVRVSTAARLYQKEVKTLEPRL